MIVSVVFAEDAANKESKADTSCYVCNSNTDATCDDVYEKNDDHKKTCEGGETFCRKTIQTGNFKKFFLFVNYILWILRLNVVTVTRCTDRGMIVTYA